MHKSGNIWIAGTHKTNERLLKAGVRGFMKKDIHPEYKQVVFHDLPSDYNFLTRSCVNTTETTEFEGATYPVYKVEVSSQSHPFYTGKNVLLDTTGRVDKFNKRYAKK